MKRTKRTISLVLASGAIGLSTVLGASSLGAAFQKSSNTAASIRVGQHEKNSDTDLNLKMIAALSKQETKHLLDDSDIGGLATARNPAR